VSFSLSDFDYTLPEELIAYSPRERGESRLLVLDRRSGSMEESTVNALPDIIEYPAVIARNVTRVVKTRFFGNRESGGRIEFLVLNPYEDSMEFKSLIKRSNKIKEHDEIKIGDDASVVIEERDGSVWKIRLNTELVRDEFFEKYGHTPLPPYIKRNDVKSDENDYQTVYAAERGSSAAPTAGLHFSHSMLERIKEKGGVFADIILHVGLGTFEPVKEERIEEHRMHSEYYSLGRDAAEILNLAKKNKTKILSVGTTSLRVLETAFYDGFFREGSGMTDIFIYPPYEIKSAQMLLTNFHIPKSTLLMLVSAFAGRDLIMDAYKYAVEKRFRFFSYGDAMLIK